jgi:hypothetical protein
MASLMGGNDGRIQQRRYGKVGVATALMVMDGFKVHPVPSVARSSGSGH